MAVTAQRRLQTTTTRQFGSVREAFAIPDLTKIQTESYARFLQYDAPADKRKDEGLEGVLREIFPIESYDKKLTLDYLRYELGKPRYEPDECRQLRLTYGRPFRIWLRLNKEQPIEEEVYLGDLPIMLGGGEFIINGAERVVVSQLHRSPGIDFVSEVEAGERRMHSCRIIPERGSWIEINTTKKDSITVRIDQSGKFSVMTLLRAMDPKYGQDVEILRTFYATTKQKVVDGRSAAKIEDKFAVDDVVYPVGSDRAGEIIVESGQKISKTAAETIAASGVKLVEVMDPPGTPLLLNALADDNTASHEEALLRIYQRLRPGNPPQLEKAKALFNEKFYDTNRYRLGRVGRFRINRKLGLNVPEDEMVLRPEDLHQRGEVRAVAGDRRKQRRGRRHRPPGQSAAADDRRAGVRRNAQGLPEAPPHRAGADEPQGHRGHDAAEPDQSEEHLGGDRVFLRPRRAVAGRRPDEPAFDAHARTAALGLGPGRFESQAGRLRSPRRAYFALRPHLPDRDAGRHEHRSDFEPRHVRGGRRVRLPDHALPQGEERQAHRRSRLAAGRRRGQCDRRLGRRADRRTARFRAKRSSPGNMPTSCSCRPTRSSTSTSRRAR